MHKLHKISFYLRPTLVSAVIFTIILTIVTGAIPAYYNTKKSIEIIWSDLALEISQKAMQRIVRYFGIAPPAAHLIQGLTSRGEIDPNNIEQVFDVCYETLLANKDLTALFFVQPNGTFSGIIEDFGNEPFLASHRIINQDGTTETQNFKPSSDGNSWISINKKEDDYDPRKRPYWESAIAHPEGGWSKPYPFLNTQERGFSYSLGQKKNGQLIGYWIFNFQINFVSRYLKKLEAGQHGLVFIVASDGSMIANSKNSESGNLETLEPEDHDIFLTTWKQFIASNQESGIFHIGQHIYYANRFDKSSGIPWSVITVIHEDDYLHEIRAHMYISMGIGFVLCVLFSIIASLFFGNISRRLKQVSIEMDQVGDLGIEKDEKPSLPSIIREINTMNASLHKMKIALRSFAKYLPLNLVKTLVHSGHLADLGGEKKEITILFSDLTNFTSISETLPPNELVEILDNHLTFMSDQVQSHGGIVDKYIGDAVMAFWGTPDPNPNHPLSACKAAIQMMKGNPKLSIKQKIGINTGNVIVGNFGSTERMDYTAIGDPVNFASRLESLNRVYGTQALIGEETAKRVQSSMVLRPLDYVKVKGKSQANLVYELIAEKSSKPHPLQPAIDLYAKALATYRNRDFSHALTLFEQCRSLFGNTDGPSSLMAERCKAYTLNPPPENWDGSKIMEEK